MKPVTALLRASAHQAPPAPITAPAPYTPSAPYPPACEPYVYAPYQPSVPSPADTCAPAPRQNPTPILGLVILTHPGYAEYLHRILSAVIEQRRSLDQIILVANGPESPWREGLARTCQTNGIELITGDWPSPQHARTVALAYAKVPWLCYLDGDNMPTNGYFAAMRRAVAIAGPTEGVCYPGTVLRVTEDTHAEGVFIMPEWSDSAAREDSIVDTSSAWRVSALKAIGGWFAESGMLDDYTTALQLWHQGWRGRRVGQAVSILRQHPQRRSLRTDTIPATLWAARRHALLTLFAGRAAVLDALVDWHMKADLPPMTEIEWLDNSDSPSFHARLLAAAAMLKHRREVKSIRVNRVTAQRASNGHPDLHGHVAKLYNDAIGGTSADVIVTLEDDVIPPLHALREILAPLQPWHKAAAVGAVYPSRENAATAVASLDPRAWSRMPALASLPRGGYTQVGMLAGGCTAWSAPALRKMLPLQTRATPCLGWDGDLSARLNCAGYRLLLSAGTRCQHLV